MPIITMRHMNSAGEVLFESSSPDLCMLDRRYHPYKPGDTIQLECDSAPIELEIMLDESLVPSIVWLPTGRFTFAIPFDEARDPYGLHAFTGDCHFGWARVLDPRERRNWRNLALNAHDSEHANNIFPHATTNSGATNPRFLARNSIDGCFQSCHHGRWPYQSWGINGRDDAWLRIEFGRAVHAEEVVLFLRADFPHDCWWERATLTCSNGQQKILHLAKTGKPQRFALNGCNIEWIELSDLIRADDPSPWPGLSQIAVMGTLATA